MSQTLSYYSNVVGGGEESRNSMSQTISVYSEVVRERGERGEEKGGGEVGGGGEEQQTEKKKKKRKKDKKKKKDKGSNRVCRAIPGPAAFVCDWDSKKPPPKSSQSQVSDPTSQSIVNLLSQKTPHDSDPDYIPGLGSTTPHNEYHRLMRTPAWAKICSMSSRNSVLPCSFESDVDYMVRLRSSLPSEFCLVRDVIESTCFRGSLKGCRDDRFVSLMLVCVTDLRVNSHNVTIATFVDESCVKLGGEERRGIQGWVDEKWIREHSIKRGTCLLLKDVPIDVGVDEEWGKGGVENGFYTRGIERTLVVHRECVKLQVGPDEEGTELKGGEEEVWKRLRKGFGVERETMDEGMIIGGGDYEDEGMVIEGGDDEDEDENVGGAIAKEAERERREENPSQTEGAAMVEEEKGNGMQLWKGVEEDEDEDEDAEEDEDEEENILMMIGGGVAEVADKSLEVAARDAEEEQEKGREGEKDDGKKNDEESSEDEGGDDELLNLL
ncbi:hypothetical protein TrCOL_g7247 [Triparma columacea]|uniref:Uncharacterized protein n=1 Tax=Triparma columacea TaxID=722753 RepID=A0A9W7G2E2_9STRA|nr:hypothetical protein TrCOL_g7247 [Triparma columacea]